ncbi:MAG TPA: T9SS type A sorting domain-containing protein [Ignavibacteria bacterium]|nr:T9SS type A sorting domain-containing protein [Ignavibacteria bacterium]HMR41217.1 T9SS type A sorting domain-containing protein [Ignavibacteria bacterium]
MKNICKLIFTIFLICISARVYSDNDPYAIELERINMPGAPAIHSFAFAEADGKWLFIGGRTNGLHGFNPGNAFPKQYSNINIFVVDPNTVQTYSRNIFSNIPYTMADPLRSTNMQYYQDGNKLYMTGGYGFDSTSNGLITFPTLTVVDVNEMIQAIITGSSIAPYIRQITDSRMQVCGGEMQKLGDYFYLIGGHKFMGNYSQTQNDQVYTDKIQKFKITDNGVSVSISDFSFYEDTTEYHRRDMNVVPAINPVGTVPFLILYGGVFIHGADLPFLNPIYIDGSGVSVDNSFSQKMSQYTCSYLSAFDQSNGSMHTTLFGGMSLYYYNEITQMQEYDSLVPFINDITTITKNNSGVSEERISTTKLPALLGTNAKFILDGSVPQFGNKVIKLDELPGRTFAGYIYGGIRALLPNNTPSFPSDYILKVYITPKTVNINHVGTTVPEKFELYQNYPNPFNPVTNLEFGIPEFGFVTLKIYNVLGNYAATLVNENLSPGSYKVQWDGSNFSSGVYYYKLESNSYSSTKKMFLLK